MHKECQHEQLTKHGKCRKGKQRWKCRDCGVTITKQHERPLGDMRIGVDRAVEALGLILEGLSVRSCDRITGLTHSTICDLVIHVGQNCERMLADRVRGLSAPAIEVDEVWSFVHCRGKVAKTHDRRHEVGNIWSWFAIDTDSKLILSHAVGRRDASTAARFFDRLSEAVAGATTITSDMLCIYGRMVEGFFGGRAIHNPTQTTTYSERFNLTLRMHVRRFARSTNAHSKSISHHAAMVALFVAFYNFCRLNAGSTVSERRVTPAMAAGVTSHCWSIHELLREAAKSIADREGAYDLPRVHSPDSPGAVREVRTA